MSLVEQELLTLPWNLSSQLLTLPENLSYLWGLRCSIFSFLEITGILNCEYKDMSMQPIVQVTMLSNTVDKFLNQSLHLI